VKREILSTLLLVFVAAGSARVLHAQVAQPDQAAQADQAAAGAGLFRDHCARCHGADLAGTKKGPSLAEIRTKKHWTDERITNRILNGAGKMPPFRESLSADQIQQLIAYLRAENRPAPPPAPAAPGQ
jgi:mono/diheme cytochrome c family protein